MTSAPEFDYGIVGGGLQGCLLAHALAWHRPEATVLLLDTGGVALTKAAREAVIAIGGIHAKHAARLVLPPRRAPIPKSGHI